jgi:hypothetical protein
MKTDGTNGKPNLSNALSWASSLVQKSSDNTLFYLLTNDFSITEDQPYSKNALLERLAEIDYSTSFKTAKQISEKIKNLNFKLRSLILLSDFQKISFNNIKTLFEDSTVYFRIVSFDYANPHNLFVDSIFLENPNLTYGETNTLYIKIKNTSKHIKMKSKIQFFIENTLVAQKKIEVEPQSNTIISFSFKITENKPLACKLFLDDEFIYFDNEFYFTLNPNTSKNVVIISNSPSQIFFEKAFSIETFYKIKTYEFGKIDYSQLALAHVIVVNGFSQINKTLINYLKIALTNGSVIILVPDSKLNSILLEDLNFLSPRLKQLHVKNTADNNEFLSLGMPDYSNPFFEQIFTKKTEKLTLPKSIQLLANLPGEKILGFVDGNSFLSHINANPGHIFIFSSPLEDNYSDFPKNALFLPILYKIASYCNPSKEKLYYTISNEFLKVHMHTDTSFGKDALYSIQKNEQEKYILPQHIQGNYVIFKNENIIKKPGNYFLCLENKVLKPLSINIDKQESETERLNFNDFEKFKTAFRNVFFEKDSDVPSDNLAAQLGLMENISLWRYFLISALVFLLLEMFIIRLKI